MIGRIPLALAALVCGLLLAAFTPVPGPRQTVLTFQRQPDFQVGDEIDFLVKLETLSGAPLEAQEIELSIGGEVIGSVETDALGAALFRLEAPFLPGTYSVEAVYRGFQFYLPASAVVDLTIAPAEIVVQTVPVIAGLEFSLAGQILRTGADGIARTSVDRAGAYILELLPNETLLSQTGAVFSQWGPGGFEPVTTVTVPGDVWKQVGFEISFPGNFIFVDPDGNPIDHDEIESVVLRGSDGMVYTVTAGETLRLYANRIFARLSGLDSVAVVHSVQSVIVDGVEVVNRGQQRFVLTPDLPTMCASSQRICFLGCPPGPVWSWSTRTGSRVSSILTTAEKFCSRGWPGENTRPGWLPMRASPPHSRSSFPATRRSGCQ
jgi:hypothetical protein